MLKATPCLALCSEAFKDTRELESPKKKSPPRGPLRQAFSQKFSGPPPIRQVDTYGNRYADSAATSTGGAGAGGASMSPARSPARSLDAELEPYPPPRTGYATTEALGGGFGSRYVEPTEPRRSGNGYATTSSLL